VISLTLFPTLTHHPRIRIPTPLLSSLPSFASLDFDTDANPALQIAHQSVRGRAEDEPMPPRTFGARLAGAVGREFGHLVRWELPISTVVQFNEVGTCRPCVMTQMGDRRLHIEMFESIIRD
jgi:hypothetical protein